MTNKKPAAKKLITDGKKDNANAPKVLALLTP
jgi:hypothetical protein